MKFEVILSRDSQGYHYLWSPWRYMSEVGTFEVFF